jgi:murein DD-endopeptidase MepM/ murein hydrolase activator NlpD
MKPDSRDKLSPAKKKGHSVLWLILLGFLAVAAFTASRLYELEKPQVAVLSDLTILGRHGAVELQIADEKSGIRSYSVVLQQGKNTVNLAGEKFIKQGIFGGGPKKLNEVIEIDALLLGVVDGRAELLITARDFSLWGWMAGNETVDSYAVAFDTKPPRLSMVDSPRSIKPGGAGIVIYSADEDIFEHGITINGDFHAGFPVPGRSTGTFGAMIGIPYDAETIDKASISAVDKAGNQGQISLGLNLRKVKKNTDMINISDGFLNKKIPEFARFYPEMTGTFIDQYVYVNNEIRKQNDQRIKEVCSHSSTERYWRGKFGRMGRSARRAGFAEYRAYFYNGSKIDDQVHLGIDLASVRHAEVEASNRGKVVFADYLGIYGNMVILDHGLGIFSLYSHLSTISVTVGELIEKGAVLGHTGMTGMAGGDHLHFSVLVNGIFVDPVEWWDESWIDLHVEQYLKG